MSKVKVETVVCEVPVESVLEVAKKVLKTGQIGDGKIFVYPLKNAVRIRTGVERDLAIIDEKSVTVQIAGYKIVWKTRRALLSVGK